MVDTKVKTKNETLIKIRKLNLFYDETHVLKDVTLDFYKNQLTTIMGPSGCGKTTLVRCLNRLNENNGNISLTGDILLENQLISSINTVDLRKNIGMVFQRPNPFPNFSIFKNVLAGYILNGIKLTKDEKNYIVQEALNQAGLWNEVKNDLHRKGTFLSGGQQQRLCIARALAMKPKVLLLDEPTSALDPLATNHIEELIVELKNNVSIIMVTHNISQASRISDHIAFLYLGKLVEYNTADNMFKNPKEKLTEEYLTRKFG